MHSAPPLHAAAATRLAGLPEGSIERVGRSTYRFRTGSGRVPPAAMDFVAPVVPPNDMSAAVSVHDVNELETAGHCDAQRESIAFQAFQKRQLRSKLQRAGEEASEHHASTVADADSHTSSLALMPPQVAPTSSSSVSNAPPMAALLLQWQLKCERLAKRVESERDRVEELEAECARLGDQAREHEADASQWEVRANRLASQLEHHKVMYEISTQERTGEHRALLGELNMLKTLRESDAETVSQLRRKVSDLEETLLRLRSRCFADAAAQTLETIGMDGHSHSEAHANAYLQQQHLIVGYEDDSLVVRVPSLQRNHKESDAVQLSGRQQFMNHLSHTINTDPELSMALGSLFVAKQQQVRQQRTNGSGDKHGAAQYNAHRGLGVNPFDDAVEYELEQHSPQKAVEACEVVSPKARPKPATRGGSVAASDHHQLRVFSPSPKAPNARLECALHPEDDDGPHLKVLCFPPPQRFQHLGESAPPRDLGGADVLLGRRASDGAASQHETQRRDRKGVATHRSPLVQVGEYDDDLLSPQLVSTVVSSASSSCGNATPHDEENVPPMPQHTVHLATPRGDDLGAASTQQPTEKEFADVVPQSEPVFKSQHLVSLQSNSLYVKSPSPCQPSTPLPPTPSSQSPYRNRVSVERIEKLRHELQYLIDMRVRLQQP